MYYLNSIEELTQEKLRQIIFDWRATHLPKLQKYKEYYDGLMEILNKRYSDPTKPCAKIVVNYCASITDSYAGYLTGIPISYASNEDITDILEILRYNDVQTEDNDFLTQALIYGAAYEVNYVDSEGQQRFKILESTECIPIYQNDLEEELIAVIRMYSANDIDNMLATYVDVYTDRDITTYYSSDGYTSYSLKAVTKHYYKMVPITVFTLNRDRKSIFDRVMSLNDAYNNLLSASIDEENSFVDAFLVLTSEDDVDSDTLKQWREDRAIVLDPGNTAEWLIKNQSNSAVVTLLDKIDKQIQRISSCPDFTDEAFMSQSGIAIRYKLVGMETKASSIEAQMKKALLRRLELISRIHGLMVGNNVWRDIDIVFTRNIPTDLTDIVSTVNSLRGLVSDKSLLGQIPFIDDVDREMEQIEKEKEAAQDVVYDFNFNEEINED